MEIFCPRCKDKFYLEMLKWSDYGHLGVFFDGLSAQTVKYFGPHPLTPDYARELCLHQLHHEVLHTMRWVLWHEHGHICGYFMLDGAIPDNEIERYLNYGIYLQHHVHASFAPVLTDYWQNYGLAEQCLNEIIRAARERGLESIVLLGGTRDDNELARSFYFKTGFKAMGSYYHNAIKNVDMMLNLNA